MGRNARRRAGAYLRCTVDSHVAGGSHYGERAACQPAGRRHVQLMRGCNNAASLTFRFEPGSTMKPFVSLLALDKGLFRSNDYINCNRTLWERERLKIAMN